MNVVIPLKSELGFLRDRLRIYGMDWAHQHHDDGFVCFLQGLNVEAPKDRHKLVTLLSNAFCGLKISLVLGFSLDGNSPGARFVKQDLLPLRVAQRIEEAETVV